jgi:hypothetical protein
VTTTYDKANRRRCYSMDDWNTILDLAKSAGKGAPDWGMYAPLVMATAVGWCRVVNGTLVMTCYLFAEEAALVDEAAAIVEPKDWWPDVQAARQAAAGARADHAWF